MKLGKREKEIDMSLSSFKLYLFSSNMLIISSGKFKDEEENKSFAIFYRKIISNDKIVSVLLLMFCILIK